MFEQTMLVDANAGRRAWTTGLGFAGEAALVAAALLAPLIWPQTLPKPQALLMLLTPPPPSPPPANVAVRPRVAQAIVNRPIFALPTHIPKSVTQIVDEVPEVVGAVSGTAQGSAYLSNSLIDSIIGSVSVAPEHPVVVKKPEPPAKVEPATPKRIRTSSIELARLIHRVEPVYPSIAKMAHVSGTVELQGIIGTDGHIRELKALTGNPLLIRAALDAVSQWIYVPPVLNGERVEVIAPITVTFYLDR